MMVLMKRINIFISIIEKIHLKKKNIKSEIIDFIKLIIIQIKFIYYFYQSKFKK